MNRMTEPTPSPVPFENITSSLFNLSLGVDILLLVKFLFLVGLFLYLAFAVIVIRQVNLMTKTLNGTFDQSLKIVAWLHLIVALGVFLFALIVL